MERLLKLVHNKAAEEKLSEGTSSSPTGKKVTKVIGETENDKKKIKVNLPTEENYVKVDHEKHESVKVIVDKKGEEVETRPHNLSKERRENFENSGSDESRNQANAEKPDQNPEKVSKSVKSFEAKLEKNEIVAPAEESGSQGEIFAEAKMEEGKMDQGKVIKLIPGVDGKEIFAGKETKTNEEKNCQVANMGIVARPTEGERKTEKNILENEASEDNSDMFEDKRVIKRIESSGQDFFERAYPILYEPSELSIYDPSQGTSQDPFQPDFGPKTRSSGIPLKDGEASGNGFKQLKDYFRKTDQDFQEYSDYIFVQNIYNAEDESLAATTSLKVLFCVFSAKSVAFLIPHGFCTFYAYSGHVHIHGKTRIEKGSKVCVLKEMHILWRKSLNENCAGFDIFDDERICERKINRETTFRRKLQNKTFDARSCK